MHFFFLFPIVLEMSLLVKYSMTVPLHFRFSLQFMRLEWLMVLSIGSLPWALMNILLFFFFVTEIVQDFCHRSFQHY